MMPKWESVVIQISPAGEFVIALFKNSNDAFAFKRYKEERAINAGYKVRAYYGR